MIGGSVMFPEDNGAGCVCSADIVRKTGFKIFVSRNGELKGKDRNFAHARIKLHSAADNSLDLEM